jgi:hypothetical protein
MQSALKIGWVGGNRTVVLHSQYARAGILTPKAYSRERSAPAPSPGAGSLTR